MLSKQRIHLLAAIAMVAFAASSAAALDVVDYDDLALDPESYFHGPDPSGETVEGPYGPMVVGAYASRGVEFTNRYDLTYDSWDGFAYSNTSDTTTPGVSNESSAITGDGLGPGADNYAVAHGYWDLEANLVQETPFDPSNPEHLNALPTLELPYGRSVYSASITNTTYAVKSMENGDTFAKAFGGEGGSDPDWFKVTAYGTGDAGQPLGVAVEFYLANYRSSDPEEDYIVREWNAWDLSTLAAARWVHFNLSSSDIGLFGMNTPAYFAIDNLTLDTTVQPGDYNADGHVNAADYTAWRDALGDEVSHRGHGADGDLDGAITTADHAVWTAHYGQSLSATLAVPVPTPEPGAAVLVSIGVLFLGGWLGRRPLPLVFRSCF